MVGSIYRDARLLVCRQPQRESLEQILFFQFSFVFRKENCLVKKAFIFQVKRQLTVHGLEIVLIPRVGQ